MAGASLLLLATAYAGFGFICVLSDTELEPSGRLGGSPHPRRWAKRKGHLRFPFLFELLPFPCFLIWRRLPTCDRSEMGNGRGFFLPCLSQPIRRVRYRTATQVGYFQQARHNRAAQLFNVLQRTAPANLGVWYNLSS